MVNTDFYSEEQLKELAFTKDELDLLAKAKQMPITFDAECPPTTPERALKFRRVNPSRTAINHTDIPS
ncbi:MAG: hypothetical protein Q4E35_03250 [Eubacteriales bacterium]|nr:hypothetical protein [Eubacteriales bacterium]